MSVDRHPDHDVSLGERLMKDVYEALRNGPAWNDTLLIITYVLYLTIFFRVTLACLHGLFLQDEVHRGRLFLVFCLC
jgi:hypothetical protein